MPVENLEFINKPDVSAKMISEYKHKVHDYQFLYSHLIIPVALIVGGLGTFILVLKIFRMWACITITAIYVSMVVAFLISRNKIGIRFGRKSAKRWLKKQNVGYSDVTIQNVDVYQMELPYIDKTSVRYRLNKTGLTVSFREITGEWYRSRFIVKDVRESFVQNHATFDLTNAILTLPCDKFGNLRGGTTDAQK